MNRLTRLTALLLCFCLLLSMAACGAKPVETLPPTEPPTEAPTEPPADLSFADAAALLAQSTDLVLKLSISETTEVGGETFVEKTEQTLYLSGWGTDAPALMSEETVTYGNDVYSTDYTEIYADGTLYVSIDKSSYFSAPMTAEEIAARYLPAVLLDASLYGSIQWKNETTIVFTDPTAAENWAMPEGAELLDASGTAYLLSSGELAETAYNLIYQYGPARVTLEVTAAAAQEQTAISAPGNPEDYMTIQAIDAPRLSEEATGLLCQAEAVSTGSLESIMSQAAGVVRNQSTIMNAHISGDEYYAKVDIGFYLMDYTTNQSQELDQEEVYKDGTYTIKTDDGEPEERTGVTDEIIDVYCDEMMLSHLVALRYWQDATIEDLGSTYLMELTLNEEFGEDIQGNICTMFWNDANFLNDLSSGHGINEVTGYIAVDKWTGLPTAAGYYYEGYHTLDGYDYILSLQSDQSIEAPDPGAYHEITEEMLPEAEPEVKATPLFYHVTGENGQEMWLFGTIHVGDERTAYLPQEIYDALEASDALALEYYSNGFDEKMEEDDALQDEVSGCYYYTDGTTEDHVGEEIYELAEKYLKASGNYTMNAPYMKASMWSSSIENFFLRQGYQLTSEQGCESRLEKLAEDMGKEIRDVESGLFQIKMLTGWSDELQKVLLEDTLEYDAQEYWEGTWELYELWCAGDEAALREELSDEVDTSELTEEELAEYEAQKHLIEEYNKAMSYDRNDGMLQVAIGYLESGDTVFYAVGLAHLLNDVNGLVDALRDAGYTVELVEYAQ